MCAAALLLVLQVAFMRNATGKVIYDRRFNTTALLASYYGSNVDFAGRINWDPQVRTHTRGWRNPRLARLDCL